MYSQPNRNTGKLTLVDRPHECAQCEDREGSVAVTCKRRHKAKAASSWGCTGVHCSAPGFHTIFLFLLDAPRLSNTRPATTFTTHQANPYACRKGEAHVLAMGMDALRSRGTCKHFNDFGYQGASNFRLFITGSSVSSNSMR